ncbi:hypothetical protein D9M70_634870 [compost metagenome]
MTLSFDVAGSAGKIRLVGNRQQVTVASGQKAEVVFFIEMDKSRIKKRKTELEVNILNGEELVETVETTFLGYTNE